MGCKLAKQRVEVREVIAPNRQLERAEAEAEAERGGAGAGCRGNRCVCTQCCYVEAIQSVLVPERVPRTTVGRSLALRTPNGGAAGKIGGGRWARTLSAVAFRGLSSLCVGIFWAWIRCECA